MIETLLLAVHILLALVSLSLAVRLVFSAQSKSIEKTKNPTTPMWVGTLLTAISGIVLTIVANISFGRLCVSLFAFMVCIVGAHAYYQATKPRSIA